MLTLRARGAADHAFIDIVAAKMIEVLTRLSSSPDI
jgi:hypothetical protein